MRLTKKRSLLGPAILMLILSGLLISCATCPESPTQIDPVPVVLDWPKFPNPQGVTMTPDSIVSMPLDYWLSIVDYKVDVDKIKKILAAVKGPLILASQGD